jgi:hypothetical protein
LEGFYARGEAPVMAFKAMYNQLADPRVRHYLCSDTEIRVIHLRRDNLLKQYVSKVLAPKKFGQQPWGSTELLPITSTKIVPERAIREMRKAQNLHREHEQIFSGHRRAELVYETIVDGHSLSDAAAVVIFELLELEPAPMKGKTVKVNPDSLAQIIDNYDEVVSALCGTEFERFLD